MKEKGEEERVKLEDLLKLVRVRVIGAKRKVKEGVGELLFLDVEHSGKRYRIKAINNGIRAILKHSRRTQDGVIEAEVPESALDGEWIVSDY